MSRFLFLIFILSIVGCEATKNEVSFKDSLLDVWKSSCQSVSDGSYFKDVLSFNENYIVSVEMYSDSGCSTQTGGGVSTEEYSYSIGGVLTSADGVEVHEFDTLREFGDHFTRETILNIIYIEGDKLYLGIPNNDNTRPSNIDFENVFYRS